MSTPNGPPDYELALERDADLCEGCTAAIGRALQLEPSDDPSWLHYYPLLSQFFSAVDQGCLICYGMYQCLDDRARTLLHEIAQIVPRVKNLPELIDEHAEDGPHGVIRLFIMDDNDNNNDDDDDDDGPPDRLDMVLAFNYTFFDSEIWEYDRGDSPDLAPKLDELHDLLQVLYRDFKLSIEGSKLHDRTKALPQTRIMSNSTGSTETFAQIKTWLRGCQDKHALCSSRGNTQLWYPTRLLEIDPLGGSVKVVHTCQFASSARCPYVTLSHRWDNQHIPILTTATLQKWTTEIPDECLSQTFRDFIIGARFLGVQYAWIDSLCIIQEGDGGADWALEAPTMDRVYKNALCNFAANWGSQSMGLFCERRTRDFDQLYVSIIHKSQSRRYRVLDNSLWVREVSQSPLAKRGWVLQERILSPRELHFGRSQVFFECCESSLCEQFPQQMPIMSTQAHLKTVRCLHDWNYVLTAYSDCALTFPSDKLIAVAGIAQHLKPLVTGIYIMGLWLPDLASQMLWCVSFDVSRLRVTAIDSCLLGDVIYEPTSALAMLSVLPEGKRTPSFTWASVDDRVYDWNCNKERIIVTASCIKYRLVGDSNKEEVITEDIYNFSPNPVVEVRVVGCLKRTRLIDWGGQLLCSWPIQSVKDIQSRAPASIRGRYDGEHWMMAYLDFPLNVAEIPALEARIFYYMPWQRPKQNHFGVHSCLLLELADTKMGRFRRIGIIEARLVKRMGRYEDPQPGEADLPCGSYDPVTRQHTIYII